MKVKVVLVFTILLALTAGLVSAESSTKTKIYETFFKDLVQAGIINTSPKNHAVLSKEEIELFKEDMKQIDGIREYSSNAAVGGGTFKKGFHLMFVHTKQTIQQNYKFLGLLYSADAGAMIVRKYDVFPKTMDKMPNITVYEFKISKRAATILKKYEEAIPKGGAFYNAWPRRPYDVE